MDMPKYPAAETDDLIRGLQATVAKQGALIAELRREIEELRQATAPRAIGYPFPDTRGEFQRRKSG